MQPDPRIWMTGLALMVLLIAATWLAWRYWHRKIDGFAALAGGGVEHDALSRGMQRGRLATYVLATLALLPAAPSVFVVILKYPSLHWLLSLPSIYFILKTAGSALLKLDLGSFFPQKPVVSSVLKNAALGLCIGFLLLLAWQMAIDLPFRRAVMSVGVKT
jgi:hypothetical protein